MKPYFIMLVGIPGSGKSRWAIDILCTQIVCPDDIRKELGSSVSDQFVNQEVWDRAKEEVTNLLKSGKNVILDTTNVNTLYRQMFMDGLPDCILIAKLFDVEPEVAYGRLQKDLRKGRDRADVPEHVIYRMYGEYLYTKRVLEEEGFEVTVIETPSDWKQDIEESRKRFGTYA